MAFRIAPGLPPALALRRVAETQFRAALRATDPASPDFHELRTSCKKLRAWLRLLRAPLGAHYDLANRLLRDAARMLAPWRDREVLREHLQRLPLAALPRAQRHALMRGPRARNALLAALAQSREMIEAARRLLLEAPLLEVNEASLRRGLDAGFRRCRQALACAQRKPSPEALHEWRKQVKYHGYQCTLLAPRWPALGSSRLRALKLLSTRLGDHHDACVLLELLRDQGARNSRAVRLARVQLEQRLGHLQSTALLQGTGLLASAQALPELRQAA